MTPVEQVAALPDGLTSEQAEVALSRTWAPVTLTERGAGVANSDWRFVIPAGLENLYQMDLRTRDMLGNVAIYAKQWRGIIDTSDPRVVMTATYLEKNYFDTANTQQRYQVHFVCGVLDRYLEETTFECPGEAFAEPVRSFDKNEAMQPLFPDWTIRSGLALSYTLWTTTTTPLATTSACDQWGRCAQATTPISSISDTNGDMAALLPAAPEALIVNPTADSFVAATDGLNFSVAAEAEASLKDVTIYLDDVVVQTLNFTQGDAVTRTVQTIDIADITEGIHTLVAKATDWDGATQDNVLPVVFTVDTQPPTVSIDTSTLTISDTWQIGSGFLRFNGTVADSVCLAAMQLKVGASVFADTNFGDGLWQTAYWVNAPEGKTLSVTARATDCAGRIAERTEEIATDLSSSDAPDTTITDGPSETDPVNSGSFSFTGIKGGNELVGFACQVDDEMYEPCTSPWNYSNLSKGEHTFRVRAIDDHGFVDVTPAESHWLIEGNRGPLAEADSVTMAQNTTTIIDVLGNDHDPDGDTLTVTIGQKPTRGTARVENNKIIYTPNTDFIGEDTLTYIVGDGKGGEATATVTVTVVRLFLTYLPVLMITVSDTVTVDGPANPSHSLYLPIVQR